MPLNSILLSWHDRHWNLPSYAYQLSFFHLHLIPAMSPPYPNNEHPETWKWNFNTSLFATNRTLLSPREIPFLTDPFEIFASVSLSMKFFFMRMRGQRKTCFWLTFSGRKGSLWARMGNFVVDGWMVGWLTRIGWWIWKYSESRLYLGACLDG